jgi:hypothetical protein
MNAGVRARLSRAGSLCLSLAAGSLSLLFVRPAFSAPAPGGKASERIFFVATNGNDGWSGGLANPNAGKTDGPFASVSVALEKARQFNRNIPSTNGHPKILLRGGTYFLSATLVLRPEDSGITIAGYEQESPVLSGGRRIAGWKEVAKNGSKVWEAEIPESRSRHWIFRELWVNGKRAQRARFPKKGYLKIEGLEDPAADWRAGQSRFRYRAGDLQNWSTISNAEALVMTKWVESRLPVLKISESNRVISFGKKTVFGAAEGDLYYLEGALEFLTEPGDWCLDSASGKLYYWPLQGEQFGKVEAVAPKISQILRLEGRLDIGQFIEQVTFRNVSFSHAEWFFPSSLTSGNSQPLIEPAPSAEAGGFAQAAIGVPGAVWGEGVHDSSFENCRFISLGDYGLELARGCERNRIVGSEFGDLGAGGLKIGDTRIPENANSIAGANEIKNCNIHDGGKMFASAIGIWVGQSANNRIVHNLIHDFYYTGISIGWTWGYGASQATNNFVAYNHVHHIGVKSNGDGPILSDMGGIYTLGRQPGTRILNNLWHDMAGERYGGWGIYFDEGSSGIVATSNIVYRTTHGGFHQHYGETNVVRNNIFAFGRDQQIQRSRPEPHLSFRFETNIVYFDSGTLLAGEWKDDKFTIDCNAYFDARPDAKAAAFRLGPTTLEKWRDRGHDTHSMIGDPKFIEPGNFDFGLQTNSSAQKMGFQQINLSEVGIEQGNQH